MRKNITPRRVAIAFFGLLLAIQIIPPVWAAQTNPPVTAEPAWDSPQTKALARKACFDCHSNETVWPAYGKVAPVSWLVTYDVLKGRRELNFSEWGAAQGGEGGERGEGGEGGGDVAETIQSGEMPPQIYLTTHPQAALTPAERQQLIDGLQRSLR